MDDLMATQLADWVVEQNQRVQEVVWEFLEGDDDALELLGELLGKRTRVVIRREEPLSHMVLRSLPASHEELKAMAVAFHPSKRPEAALRQFLRRAEKEGKIHYDERTGIYSHA